MNTSPCPGSCTLISSALNPRTSNLTTNLPSSCFAFSSTHPSPSRSRTLPLFKDLVTRDVTVVGSTLSGSLIIFLNSLFSNPSSLSDRCWPCKIISYDMPSGLYLWQRSSHDWALDCQLILTALEARIVSRACSSSGRAISLHKSRKNPKPETASS